MNQFKINNCRKGKGTYYFFENNILAKNVNLFILSNIKIIQIVCMIVVTHPKICFYLQIDIITWNQRKKTLDLLNTYQTVYFGPSVEASVSSLPVVPPTPVSSERHSLISALSAFSITCVWRLKPQGQNQLYVYYTKHVNSTGLYLQGNLI